MGIVMQLWFGSLQWCTPPPVCRPNFASLAEINPYGGGLVAIYQNLYSKVSYQYGVLATPFLSAAALPFRLDI